ncbi:DUF2442 domain-containing protein [bacterium]|nr:DUF2442 domain-containing protein [bacterium]
MKKIVALSPQPDLKLWLKFDDGVEGTVDLSHLKGKGVFQIWDDVQVFQRAYIDVKTGAVAWSDEVDVCADSLYLRLTNKRAEELVHAQN